MPRPPLPSVDASRVLALARQSRAAAREALSGLDVAGQAALICETPIAQRADLLELLPAPERVIPALPEAELCFTAKAIGLADAGWMLQYASLEQIRTAVDLDAWRGLLPDRTALADWLASIAEASDDKLLETVRGIDRELVVLWLRDAATVVLKPNDDYWDPPDGAMTLEGQFFLVAKRDDEDLELVMSCLRVVFEADYGLYFQLVQGAIAESDADCEEYALRWRTARLADLGFPCWEEAMRIYGHVRAEDRASVPVEASALDVQGVSLPAEAETLPGAFDGRHAVFRATAALAAGERRVFFQRFVALANQVAVASGLPLGDPESIPTAIERAAVTASLGLEHVARESGLPEAEVLRHLSLERLHRVGASLAAEVKNGTRPPI